MAFSAPADFLSGEQPVLCLLAGGYASALNGQYAGNLGETGRLYSLPVSADAQNRG